LKKASSTPSSKPHHHLDGVAEDGIDEHPALQQSTSVRDLQREKLRRRNPKTTESQTPLPPATGHHGRRRREGERPAVRSGGRFKKRTTWVKSPQGQNSRRASSIHTCSLVKGSR
jgi:hypothetical protein